MLSLTQPAAMEISDNAEKEVTILMVSMKRLGSVT